MIAISETKSSFGTLFKTGTFQQAFASTYAWRNVVYSIYKLAFKRIPPDQRNGRNLISENAFLSSYSFCMQLMLVDTQPQPPPVHGHFVLRNTPQDLSREPSHT